MQDHLEGVRGGEREEAEEAADAGGREERAEGDARGGTTGPRSPHRSSARPGNVRLSRAASCGKSARSVKSSNSKPGPTVHETSASSPSGRAACHAPAGTTASGSRPSLARPEDVPRAPSSSASTTRSSSGVPFVEVPHLVREDPVPAAHLAPREEEEDRRQRASAGRRGRDLDGRLGPVELPVAPPSGWGSSPRRGARRPRARQGSHLHPFPHDPGRHAALPLDDGRLDRIEERAAEVGGERRTSMASTLATERVRYSTSHQLVQTQAGRPAHLSA